MRPDHHSLGVDHPEAGKKRGMLRRLFRYGLILVAVLVLLIAFLPMLLSSGPGTRLLASLISSRIDGEIAFDDVSIRWLSGQSFSGVQYISSDGATDLRIGSIDAGDISLASLVMGNRDFGKLVLDHVQLDYNQDPAEPGGPSIPASGAEDPSPPRSPKQTHESEPFRLPAGFAYDLTANDIELRYRAEGLREVRINSTQVQMAMTTQGGFTFSGEGTQKQGNHVGGFGAEIAVDDLFSSEGVFQPMEARYDLTLSAQRVPVDASARFLSRRRWKSGLLDSLLGDANLTQAVLGGQFVNASISAKGLINQIEARVQADSQKTHVDIALEYDEGGSRISPESVVRLQMNQATYAALAPKSASVLVDSVDFYLSHVDVQAPRDGSGFDLDAFKIDLTLESGTMRWVDAERNAIQASDFSLRFKTDALSQSVSGSLNALLSSVNTEGERHHAPFEMELEVLSPLSDEPRFQLTSTDFPIVLADAMLGAQGTIVLFLGQTLEDIEVSIVGGIERTAKDETQLVYRYTISPAASRLYGNTEGQWSNGVATLQTPGDEEMEATLTPEAFAFLMSLISGNADRPVWTIDENLPVYLTIENASVGRLMTRGGEVRSDSFDPETTRFKATIELTETTVWDPQRQRRYELRSGTIAISPGKQPGEYAYSADLELWVPPDAGAEGFMALMRMEMTVFDVIDTGGGIPSDPQTLLEMFSATGGLSMSNMPSTPLDTAMGREGDVAALLGPVVQDMDIQLRFENGQPSSATARLNWDDAAGGPISGANAAMAPIEFAIDDAGMMTVADGSDIQMQFEVRPELGDAWMGRLHPVLFDAQSSDRPVRVAIDGSTFRYPLGDAAMEGAQVDAVVDLGSVQFGEDSLLGKIMEWADHPGDRAVFEPARVTIRDGQIEYSDMSLSVGNVQLRFDGSVDLVEREISDMEVRVPAESLIKVFNELEGVIAEDDELVIPMTGSIRSPRVETQAFREELLRLISRRGREQVQSETDELIEDLRDKVEEAAGEEASEFVGGVLGVLFGRGGDDGE